MNNNDWPIPTVRNFKWNFYSKISLMCVATLSKLWIKCLNKIKVHNRETLMKLVEERDKKRSLITVTNHDSCLDDPLVIAGLLPMKIFIGQKLCRWSLGAKEICHTTKITSKIMCLGQVMPIVRGNGIYQIAINKAIDELNEGNWIHIFPEGRVNELKETIRYKWGVARLLMDTHITPIVLPFYHCGMDTVLPNKEPYIPQIGKRVTACIGTPLIFDNLINELKEQKKTTREIRIIITNRIQEEMAKLKEITEEYHRKHLANS
jgi:monolysocardiolipin acyltransferase